MDEPPRLRLTIASTWDGRPLPATEHVVLTLAGDDEHLLVEVDAPFHADPPPLGLPGPTDGLWEHEVVELFVAGGETAVEDVPYLEVELSPHGHHLVLVFRGARRALRRGLPLDYLAEVDGGRWRGRARLPRSLLPPPPHRLNAYALHGLAAKRRYLAW